MLQDPESPDKGIALLVSTWTEQLVTKADKFEQALKKKKSLIDSLEKENEELDAQNAGLQAENKQLQTRLSRLEPASNGLQDEITRLKSQVQQIATEKDLERQKVQNLNNQLSTMFRQAKADKTEYEKSMSRQTSMVGDEELKDLKAKYETLGHVAKEVVKDCGMMAGDNFGPIGLALLKLKKHMEQ
jgi:chromosome segregation ATPase